MKKYIVLIATLVALVCLTPTKANAAQMDAKAGTVTTKVSSLNIRASASASSQRVGSLRKGSYIILLGKTGAWWKVEYADGKYGYCHADYITIVEGTPAKVATKVGALNVRSGAGFSYGVQAQLPKGEVVLVLSQKGDWSRVLYNGTKTGYVSSQYLSLQQSNAVSLAVPSYKQWDSRWSGVEVGNSGKTIGQIGCATTAIAMMESFRTGTTIHPDAMMRKLNYTSSGNVYWPGHFVTVTSSADYLARIQKLLQGGKPVMLGTKNNYGGQHWVVITGFSGGDITASNFTIQDPGSNVRTNLAQFLNAYPNFYKYFYYS